VKHPIAHITNRPQRPGCGFASLVLSIFVLLSCCFGRTVRAQQGQPDSYAGFEGRKVERVDITGPPTIQPESFRALLRQKEGQPFSIEAIRESVAALQHSNEFTQVQVSIEPQPAGLRVIFILQPASYIGLISFPGATKKFAYTRLLEAAGIQEQAPFIEKRLPDAKKALLDFLASNGYFASTVETEIHRDDPHRIVNLTFRITLNHRARIGAIEIAGLPNDEAAAGQKLLRSFRARLKGAYLKPGQRYSPTGLRKSTDFLRDRLAGNGHLAPSLNMAPPKYEGSTSTAAITFQATPGPKLDLKVTGAHISNRKLKSLIPIYEENTVDLDLVAEGKRNLTSYLESKGFYDARVTSQMNRQGDTVEVAYTVERGEHHKVTGVSFSGNHFLDDDQLAKLSQVKRGKLFSRGKYSSQFMTKTVNSITAAYKNAGYAKVSVRPDVKDFEPEVDVTFVIDEGTRQTVRSLRVVNTQGQPVAPETQNKPLNLGAGKPYSPALLQQDRDQILASLLDRGYLNARFNSTANPDPAQTDTFDVVYTVDAGPQARTKNVVLIGNEKTNSHLIQNVITPNVRQDIPIGEGKLLTAESDLYGLGVFDWASVRPLRPISTQTEEEVVVKVHEAKQNTMVFGAGLEVIPRSGNIPVGTVAIPGLPPIGLGSKFKTSQESFFGPRGSFEYDRKNVRGRAETVSFSVLASRLDQRVSLTYQDPHFLGSSWTSLFSVSGERTTENSIYTAELGQASFQVQKALDAKKTKNVIFRYSFQRTNLSNITIPDLVLPQDQRVRLSTFSAEYLRDTRDKPLDAHRGLYQTLVVGVTPTALGSSADFVRVLGQTAYYRQVKPWLVFANNVRLGFAVPFAGSDVPLSERFFSGGADSLRGFPINGAGPQRPVQVCANPADATTCTLISVPVGGDMLFVINSEGRFPIPLKSGLGGVLFYDGGNVYNNINFHQFTTNYANSVGIGFRYDTPVGPVRFDVGYRITSVPGVKSTQYFVTLGQSF
jgi:outer membrane protein insertion porin family